MKTISFIHLLFTSITLINETINEVVDIKEKDKHINSQINEQKKTYIRTTKRNHDQGDIINQDNNSK